MFLEIFAAFWKYPYYVPCDTCLLSSLLPNALFVSFLSSQLISIYYLQNSLFLLSNINVVWCLFCKKVLALLQLLKFMVLEISSNLFLVWLVKHYYYYYFNKLYQLPWRFFCRSLECRCIGRLEIIIDNYFCWMKSVITHFSLTTLNCLNACSNENII